MMEFLRKIYLQYKKEKLKNNYEKNLKLYIKNGKIPWSVGYYEYKWENIQKYISEPDILFQFAKKKLDNGFGIGIDERIVEYPWIINNLPDSKTKLLDAGSTFNFQIILDQVKVKEKELTIYTYFPEVNKFNEKRISYVYGDLRELPFRDEWFDGIVCQSTIEHIDMNNSIYGYDIRYNRDESEKSYEYLKAVHELLRILKSRGYLFLTFPCGKFEHHGFFQQFDLEMIDRIIDALRNFGQMNIDYLKYSINGWNFCDYSDCKDIESFNPHTGKGKGIDGAAHCRAVCCIKFIKN